MKFEKSINLMKCFYMSKHLPLLLIIWSICICFDVSCCKLEDSSTILEGGISKEISCSEFVEDAFDGYLEKSCCEIRLIVAFLSEKTLELFDDREIGLMQSMFLQNSCISFELKVNEQIKLSEPILFLNKSN